MLRRCWASRRSALIILVRLFLLLLPEQGFSYSVLSHEAIIDTLWDTSLKPLLLARFPNASPEDLHKAHAYAYGGCIIQDLGYYPFGNKFFSDLAHYVRTGDFVSGLLRDSQNLNEYAFALGSLAHYAADNKGHPLAVNKTVPLVYPKLRKKFGGSVTYGEDPTAHLRTEFAFDVAQVAHGHYAPENYHDFIGFEVAEDLLKRTFAETYSLELDKVFSNFGLSIGTYRWSVSSVIPTMTKAAWASNKIDIAKEEPGMTKKRFLYNLSRASYRKEWGTAHEKPGFWARVLGFFIRLMPRIGPLRAFRIPKLTPESQKLFMASFNATLDEARRLYSGQREDKLTLPDENLDIGEPTRAGTYPLADETYAKLTDMLAKNHYAGVPPELRDSILDYYGNPKGPVSTQANPKDWKRLQGQLAELKAR